VGLAKRGDQSLTLGDKHVRSSGPGEDSVLGIGDGALTTKQSTATMHQVCFGSERTRVRLSVVTNVHVGRHRDSPPNSYAPASVQADAASARVASIPPWSEPGGRSTHRVAQRHGHDRVGSVLKALQVHVRVKWHAANQLIELGKLGSFVIGGHGGQSSIQHCPSSRVSP
jgi:hypothetical protein